jgi:hypothetical protein
MNVTNIAFQNSIYLNMAPLVPAVKPRELEIGIQLSHYNDVHFVGGRVLRSRPPGPSLG